MSDWRKDIGSVLSARNEEKQREAAEKERRANKQAEVIEKFNEKRRTTYKPAFEEIGNEIRANGFEFVVEQKTPSSYSSASGEHSITLFISDRPIGVTRDRCPYLCIRLLGMNGEVGISRSTITAERGGQTGHDSSFTIDDLTTDIIQQKVVDLVRRSFGAR